MEDSLQAGTSRVWWQRYRSSTYTSELNRLDDPLLCVDGRSESSRECALSRPKTHLCLFRGHFGIRRVVKGGRGEVVRPLPATFHSREALWLILSSFACSIPVSKMPLAAESSAVYIHNTAPGFILTPGCAFSIQFGCASSLRIVLQACADLSHRPPGRPLFHPRSLPSAH